VDSGALQVDEAAGRLSVRLIAFAALDQDGQNSAREQGEALIAGLLAELVEVRFSKFPLNQDN
jgi:hypothetical protein